MIKRCLTAIFSLVLLVVGRNGEAALYKVKINVNTAVAVTNYPVSVNVDAKTLQQATGSTYPDMRGLRFTNASGAQLPFWIHPTKHAQRTIGNLPVWVQVDSLAAGNTTIYMTYDPTIINANTTPLPNGNTYCGAEVTAASPAGTALPSAPFSGGACGENVFGSGMFAWDYNEYLSYTYPSGGCGQWALATASDGQWVYKNNYWVNSVPTANNFLLHYRYHVDSTSSWTVYFLTQNSATPAPANLNSSYKGYKMTVSYVSGSTPDTYTIQLWRSTTAGSWSTVGSSITWQPYNNTINEFDIKVSGSPSTSRTISTTINGALLGSVTTASSDGFSNTGGYVGFNSADTTGAECDSFATNTISPIWVINNDLSSEPTVSIVGNTDILMDETIPNTVDASSPYLGQNVIEVVPQMQVLGDYVSGNTLDKYIYSAYPLASIQPGSAQWFKYSMFINNRGSSSSQDTFNISLSTTPASYSGIWNIGYAYPAGSTTIVQNLPGTGGTPTSGQITLAGGATEEIDVYAMPSINALFQGNQGKLTMNFKVQSTTDFSQDNVQFVGNVEGKSGCYWQYQLPITISYTDSNLTCNLLNYQVLVTLNNVNFSEARPDGADLIFTDAAGTMIPFWIKSFKQGSSGSGSFWVQVPTIASSCTPSPPTGSCPSSCTPTAANTTIYLWWGNSNYSISYSNERNTFDLWEDWSTGGSSTRTVGSRPGCPDGPNDTDSTLTCNTSPTSQAADPTGWLNNPSPSNPFNWWQIASGVGLPPIPTSTSNVSANSIQTACRASSDAGPILSNGNVNWKNYEVMYTSKGNFCNTQATYNPVLYADSGNMWGFESFSNEFIFRPFTYGSDWVWNYQNQVSNVAGFDSTYPISGDTYINKVRVFHNPSTGLANMIVMSTKANSTPADADSDTGFYTLGNINPSIQVTSASGEIGFGGWDGGQNYGNIRVRKYCEPDPANNTTPGSKTATEYQSVETLSTPTITPPLMNGRAVLLTASLTPWTWTGDLTAIYADCYINGDCKTGESQTQLGTISLWGDTSATTPTGFGAELEAAVAGDNNRSTIPDAYWQSDGRYIFTDVAGQTGNYAFGVANASTLAPLLFPNLSSTAATAAAPNLIRYVRGQYQSAYARATVRNFCTSGTADTCQWKLDDIIHSSPLVVGIPNMLYSDPNYSTFENANNGRDLVAYIGTNGGMIHAVRMAYYNASTQQYQKDTSATELWAFIPNGLLGSLSSIAKANHQYAADGLLRAIDITTTTSGAPYTNVGTTYKTLLVGGLRNGGQSLFAIDITNPESPAVLFDINAATNPAAFANIGRSWSAPALGRLCETQTAGVCTGGRWVAIIGSGLDPYDLNNLTKTAYLTIIDLSSIPGSVINQIQVSTKPGNITSNVAVLRDQNGYIQKVYFGDYYGALWGVKLLTPSNVTTVETESSLNPSNGDMLFQPSDYATSNLTASAAPLYPITSQPTLGYAGNNLYWVYFGTGVYDLYNSSYPNQAFYGLQDTGGSTPLTSSQLVNMTFTTATNPGNNSWFITLGQSSNADVNLSGVNGTCANSCTAGGVNSATYCNSVCLNITSSTKDSNERVLNPAVVYGGYVFFSTYDPLSTPCVGGVSRFYGVAFNSGSIPAGLMLSSSNTTPIRSTVISSSGGVPSTPMVFSGSGGQGQVVAAGIENVSSGGLTKVMLNPIQFGKTVNILYWRRKQ